MIIIESLPMNCLVWTKLYLEQVSPSYAEPAFVGYTASYTAVHWV